MASIPNPDRLRLVDYIKDEKEQCEMFTRDVVFTLQAGDPISDADLDAFLGGTGGVLPAALGGPTSTSYVDDFRLQSWIRKRREPVPQAQDSEKKAPLIEDEVVATYTKIVVNDGSADHGGGFTRPNTRSTVSGSYYVESTKAKVEGSGIHVGSPWRKGMEGYFTFHTYGFSTIANDPGSPQVGMTRNFTVTVPGTVTTEAPTPANSRTGMQSVIVTGAQGFGVGTGTDGHTQQPAVAAITILGSVSKPTRVQDWSMGRYLYETEWRAWVPMAVYGGTTANPTIFYMKPRQEIGWRFQIRGLEMPTTIEWVFRHTSTWEADFLANFPKGSSYPSNCGSSNPNGQTLLDYTGIINVWSGEDEVEAKYGLYIGGSGWINAGYLVPFSETGDVAVQATGAGSDGTHPVVQAGTDPGGAAFWDSSGNLCCFYSTGNMCVTGWKLEFDLNPWDTAWGTKLQAIWGYINSDSGRTNGMKCVKYDDDPHPNGVRTRVYFAQLTGAVKAQKCINQGGTYISDGSTPLTIAFVGQTFGFGTDSSLHILG